MTSDAEGVLASLRSRFAPNVVLLMGGHPITRNEEPHMKPLFYLNRTHVIERLDEVLSPLDWSDEYFQAGSATVCKLSIRIGDTWYSKSDASGDTDIGGEKGAATGALKRAASKWGVGSYLYRVDNDEYLPGFYVGDRGPFFTTEAKESASRLLWDDWFLSNDPSAMALLGLCKGCTSEEDIKKLLDSNSEIVKNIAKNENMLDVFKRTLKRYKIALNKEKN